jgi:uncharacterized membrane protein
LVIELGIGMFANIPFIGPLFSIANFVIAGPFMGGVFYLYIRGARGEPAQIGDIFEGFKRAFGQLFLATLVQSLFLGLCMLPFIIVLAVKFIGTGLHLDSQALNSQALASNPEFVHDISSILLISLPVLLICLVPAMYLSVSWKFTLPLIMDKQLDFWTAMKTSWKRVNKHWWQVFGLIILIGLLNAAGFLACCIGMVFTIPVGFAALMFAYETIFSPPKSS